MDPRLLLVKFFFFPLQENWILCPPGDKHLLLFFPLSLQRTSQISPKILAAAPALALRQRRASRRRGGSALLLQKAVVKAGFSLFLGFPVCIFWLHILLYLSVRNHPGRWRASNLGSFPSLTSCCSHHCCLAVLGWSSSSYFKTPHTTLQLELYTPEVSLWASDCKSDSCSTLHLNQASK